MTEDTTPEETKNLIANLKDPDWEIRGQSATLLGKKKEKLAVKPLIEALKDNRINDNRVVNDENLHYHADDSDRKMKCLMDESGARINMVYALGEIGDKRAIDILVWIIESDKNGLIWSDEFLKQTEEEKTSLRSLGITMDPNMGYSKPWYIYDLHRSIGYALIKIARNYLNDKIVENLAKFLTINPLNPDKTLKRDDPATFRMGLSLLKGAFNELE